MIYNKNLVIFIILIILVLGCVYSVNNYYERNIILKFYNNNLEKNSLIPSKPILDSGLILDYVDKYYFDKKIEKEMSVLRWFEEEVNKKNNLITKDICNNHLKIIYKCYYLVVNKMEDFIIDCKRILEELNDRITFYYRFINLNGLFDINYNNKNIKVIKVSKHHHAVEWIYRNVKDNLGTVLHVDSHADMNPIGNDCKFIKSCIDNSDFSFNNLKRIFDTVDNIGSVLVPMLSPYNFNKGIVWLTPDWVKEPLCESKNIITTTKNTCTFIGKCPVNFPVKINEKTLTQVIFNEDNKKLNIMTSNIKFKDKIIEKISDDYILNIDLDYFVTFGTDSYLPGGVDAISDNRTIFDPSFIFKNQMKYVFIKKELDLEMDLIRKRIDDFLDLVICLKNKGKIPKIIIICDSTRVDFTNDQLGQEFMTKNESELTNEFTPKYLTFWLHNTIHRHIKSIFTIDD